MASTVRQRRTKQRSSELARRLAGLIEGLTVSKILRADEQELVVEFDDGTRLLVRAGETLDVSVT